MKTPKKGQKKHRLRNAILFTLGALYLIGSLGSNQKEKEDKAARLEAYQAQAESMQAKVATPKPTKDPKPTATATPAPTDTPEPTVTATPVPEEDADKKQVKKAQKYLAKAGYYDGEADGKLDKETKKAVKKYRKAAGLPVSTEVDDELIQSLKSDNYGLPLPTESAAAEAVEVIDIIPTETPTPTPEPTSAAAAVIPIPAESAGGSGVTRSTGTGAYPFKEYERETGAKWILNTDSMKIHHPGCWKVKEISPENYAESNLSLDELLAMGYTTCKMKGDFG